VTVEPVGAEDAKKEEGEREAHAARDATAMPAWNRRFAQAASAGVNTCALPALPKAALPSG
jgi:hypothetical protein